MVTKFGLLITCALVLNACQGSRTFEDSTPTPASTAGTAPTVDALGEECPKPAGFAGGGAEVSYAHLAAFDAEGTQLWTMRQSTGVGHSFAGSSPFVLILGCGRRRRY